MNLKNYKNKPEKAVTWTEIKQDPNSASNGNKRTDSRKRFAIRDQPTWYNCKQPRPPTRYEIRSQSAQTDYGTLPSTPERSSNDLLLRNSSPRHSTTPKTGSGSMISSMHGSERCSSSSHSSELASKMEDIMNSESKNSLTGRIENGRDVLRRKGGEHLVGSKIFSMMHNAECLACKSADRTRSLSEFRIPSATSTHRSPDVSIGLRHISRLLQVGTGNGRSQNHNMTSQRRRSESILLSLTKVTSNNIEKSRRRQSEPLVPLRPHDNASSIGVKSLAPGEGYLSSRRRSSLSAPATHGTESNSGPSDRTRKPTRIRYRALPTAGRSPIYADREWRPPTLQKYSTVPPWAPHQQTTRYFPKYSNLQDVHLRNPYLVPGSILYKTYPVYN